MLLIDYRCKERLELFWRKTTRHNPTVLDQNTNQTKTILGIRGNTMISWAFFIGDNPFFKWRATTNGWIQVARLLEPILETLAVLVRTPDSFSGAAVNARLVDISPITQVYRWDISIYIYIWSIWLMDVNGIISHLQLGTTWYSLLMFVLFCSFVSRGSHGKHWVSVDTLQNAIM